MVPGKAGAARARARARLQSEIRAFLGGRGYEEVETPSLVPAPGMEPHIRAFEAPFVPEGGGAPPRGGPGARVRGRARGRALRRRLLPDLRGRGRARPRLAAPHLPPRLARAPGGALEAQGGRPPGRGALRALRRRRRARQR